MTTKDILELRLWNEQLTETTFSDPAKLVAWFGAVQSQDFPAAKWVLGQRLQNATDEIIENAFNKGEILRTHVMRPTWHFVHPEDIRWMLTLTAPRVKAIMGYYYRQLGLNETILKKTQDVFTQSLKGKKQLTRSELAEALAENGIDAKGQKLGHIVGEAELDGVICSGPKKGKQFTYMLLLERAPKAKDIPRDEALAELTKRYFQSHGPATMKDFSWWSGLSMLDSKKGIEMHKQLISETVDGKKYYFFKQTPKPMKQDIYLLPNYDEYTIAYKERELYFNPEIAKGLPPVGQATPFAHALVKDGVVIGLYRRTPQKDSVTITPKFFKKATAEEMRKFQKTVEKYGKFLDIRITIQE